MVLWHGNDVVQAFLAASYHLYNDLMLLTNLFLGLNLAMYTSHTLRLWFPNMLQDTL